MNGIDWPVKGTIAVCSADNLGSQELGGFKLLRNRIKYSDFGKVHSMLIYIYFSSVS